MSGKGSLVLTRRPKPHQDLIIIDHKLEVKLTHVNGETVRLAFRSLDGSFCEITRGEIYVRPEKP